MVTVVCTRWLDAFPASYVHVMRSAVSASLDREHRFICITDDPASLADDIEAIELPEMGLPHQWKKHGCWPKLSIFKPGLLPPDAATLYLDLDVLIQHDLDAFFERLESSGGGFHALQEWNPGIWGAVPHRFRPDRGVQGSILGFFPREQAAVYQHFMGDRDSHCQNYKYDQDFLTETLDRVHYWPVSWTASFKRHCLNYFPINQLVTEIKRPLDAKIVVFHGEPRPLDVVPRGSYRWGPKRKFGYGPVDWVRDYWLRHDKTWTDQFDANESGGQPRQPRLAG